MEYTTERKLIAVLERIAAALEAASPEKQLAATLKLMPEAMQAVSKAVARERDNKLVRETAGLPGLAPRKFSKGLSPTKCRECGKRIKKGAGFCKKCEESAHSYMHARRANGDQ